MVLIVIDGLDASGKSTQAQRLSSFLRGKGRTVLLRFHPSDDNYLGVRAKQYLYREGKGAHFAAALFYMLDVFRSILLYSWRNYDFIVFVRYLMGTAYLPSPFYRITYHCFSLIVPRSHLMFFLDVKPEEAYSRIRCTRKRLEMFESPAELKHVRHKALSLALIDNWMIIDADKTIAEIQAEIQKRLP